MSVQVTNLSHTSVTGLRLARFFPGHWQHIDCNDYSVKHKRKTGHWAQVGPIYPTKTEAMADTRRYAEGWGL